MALLNEKIGSGFTSFEEGILLISGSNPTHSKESSSFCREASLSKKRFLLVSTLITKLPFYVLGQKNYLKRLVALSLIWALSLLNHLRL